MLAVQSMIIDPADAVHLNIGGQRFTTSRAVLRRGAPDFFDSITDVTTENTQRDNPDASNQPIEVLIDRDPRHFHVVLAFLRNGRCTLPDTIQGLVELRAEAEAYQVPLPTWYVSGPTTSACGAVHASQFSCPASTLATFRARHRLPCQVQQLVHQIDESQSMRVHRRLQNAAASRELLQVGNVVMQTTCHCQLSTTYMPVP
jgi:BTB/POZ domain